MAIVMKRKSDLKGDYTDEEKKIITDLIDLFRVTVNDDDPEKNILDKKTNHYSDQKILALIKRALSDINGTPPRTTYSLTYFVNNIDDTILIDGAVLFAMMGEGILQLRNQVDFSDSGLTIAMFNKTGQYQSWVQLLMQNYFSAKAEIKATVNAGTGMFIGIESEFSDYAYWAGGGSEDDIY